MLWYIMLNNVFFVCRTLKLTCYILSSHRTMHCSLWRSIYIIFFFNSSYKRISQDWFHPYTFWRTWEYFWNRRKEAGPPPFSKNFERVAICLSTCIFFLTSLYVRLYVYTYLYTYIRSYIRYYTFILFILYIHILQRKGKEIHNKIR